MRRLSGLVVSLFLVAFIGVGGELPGWSSDGACSYSSAVVVQNVSSVVAQVNVTYQTPCDPATPDYQVTVSPGTTQTAYVNDLDTGPWNASAVVTSDVPILATQNFLTSDSTGGVQWAAHSGGVTAPSTTWYLAEGSTYGGFQSYISVQNVGEQPASVSVTYTVPGTYMAGPSMTVGPYQVSTVAVSDTLQDWSSIGAVVSSDVPVIAQITTTSDGGVASTTSLGTSSPSTTWYLAEGTTTVGGDFQTHVMIQNPDTSAAQVQFSFISEGTQHTGPTATVPPMQQQLFYLDDSFPNQSQFATVVTSDVPIVAVQTRTWDNEMGRDDTMGVASPSTQWYFPVAHAQPGMSSWLAIQNVGDSSAQVIVDYQSQMGPSDQETMSLGPYARHSISLPDELNGEPTFSVVVTSDQPIVAMQGSYWETGSGTYIDTNFGTMTLSRTWYLPATPQMPPCSGMESGSTGSATNDRDGDGVPDDEDYCPDYPGSSATNGC